MALVSFGGDEIVTPDGKAHNPFVGGRNKAIYAIGRFGKQFHGDMHSFHLMQTAVIRDENSFDMPTRNGYTTGADFELNFRDRMYQVTGSFVVGGVQLDHDVAPGDCDDA